MIIKGLYPSLEIDSIRDSLWACLRFLDSSYELVVDWDLFLVTLSEKEKAFVWIILLLPIYT